MCQLAGNASEEKVRDVGGRIFLVDSSLLDLER